MALSTVSNNNRGIKFLTSVVREFVRGDMFKPYKSESQTAIIRVMMLSGKYGGDEINVPIVAALSGSGVGSGPLEGNEEKIDNYGARFRIDWWRNAVRATKAEIKKGSFDLFGQAAPLVAEQAKRVQRDETVVAMLAIPSETPSAALGSDLGRRVNGILWTGAGASSTPWANEASATQRNNWDLANGDRVLYGQAFSNRVAGNVASSFANVSAGSGKMTAKTIRIAKAKAKKTSPRIEPVTTDDGYERFVLFVGSNGFRDLNADAEIYAANKDARPRESRYLDNPIFNDGDLIYNGVIIREVPEIDTLLTQVGVGASGSNVTPAFLCGRNALAWVASEEMEPTKLDDTDYQFHKGVGIEMAYGVGKIAKKSADGTKLTDWGVFTIFHNSADDA